MLASIDEGVTGTKLAKRDGLLRLLADCDKGMIDYIIVKSISRFSRNTVDSIEIVRKLCQDGIYIYFEKEKIDGVIHFAGYKAVGESIEKPLENKPSKDES